MSEIYPWHQSQWQTVHERMAQGRLPHGILLTGPAGVGKRQFAQQLAELLLCQTPSDGQACGRCRTCALLLAHSHPDLDEVKPPEDKKIITVDLVREVAHFLSLTSQYQQYKVVVISPADAMNVNAANSLLKTLEEPTSGSILFLVTHQPAQLPATIRSRCQELKFTPAAPEIARPWLSQQLPNYKNIDALLSMSKGAPLKALQIADKGLVEQRLELLLGLERLAARKVDPLTLSKQWLNIDGENSLYWMYDWVADMIRLSSVSTRSALPFESPDIKLRLSHLADKSDLSRLIPQLDRVSQAIRHSRHNYNAQLAMEDLLVQWMYCFSKPN